MNRDDKSDPIQVNILGKEYQIACREEDQSALSSASALLDARMREIRSSGKVLGTERVAVMAALNIAHELIESQQNRYQKGDVFFEKIKALQEQIDTELARNKNLGEFKL